MHISITNKRAGKKKKALQGPMLEIEQEAIMV